MIVNLHALRVSVLTKDQYKVNVSCDMKLEDLKKTLYYLMKNNPNLWKTMEKIRDSLDNQGYK